MSDLTASRRDFLRYSAAWAGSATLAGPVAHAASSTQNSGDATVEPEVQPNMLGIYGPWAASFVGDEPPEASFRRPKWRDLEEWRRVAHKHYVDALIQPATPYVPQVSVIEEIEYDGLHIERLTWQLPYGPPTEAIFLKPTGVSGRLPAILGLHDHGGIKFFGKEKITRLPEQHPLMRKHQEYYYGGVAWANELAKRGYAVLVHDTFLFSSRRVRLSEIPEIVRRRLGVGDLETVDPNSEEQIRRYNRFAAEHEHLVAKSLFCAGITWPGVFTYEDQCALSYLCARPDVDPERVGCAGLSGGGLRTVYLSGLDPRIRAACCVGMMTTWRDYLLNKCFTHTWMIYIPRLPRYLDYPEILGLMVPKPVLVLNCEKDFLFTLPEMKRAEAILRAVYEKAGAGEMFRCSYYPVPHRFNRPMQAEAFAFFDRHLRDA